MANNYLYTLIELTSEAHKLGITTCSMSTMRSYITSGGLVPDVHNPEAKKPFPKYYFMMSTLIDYVLATGNGKSELSSKKLQKLKKKYLKLEQDVDLNTYRLTPKVETAKPKAEVTVNLDKIPDPKPEQSPEDYIQELGANGEEITLTDANIYKTLYMGKMEKLKYEREKGLLVSREEVENQAFNVTRSIRDKILTIPERMSNELASMDNAHAIKELLYSEFGDLLNSFSEESFK